MAPYSSVKVTHISKQYFILGWLDGSFWAGDQEGKWEGELSSSSSSHGSFCSLGWHICMAIHLEVGSRHFIN